MKIILGSSSSSRRKILNNSGVVFTTKKPPLNESIEKRKFKGSKKELPIYLAEKKALSINSKKQDLVIGADQILLFKGRVYDKPKSLTEAKKHILEFSGILTSNSIMLDSLLLIDPAFIEYKPFAELLLSITQELLLLFQSRLFKFKFLTTRTSPS